MPASATRPSAKTDPKLTAVPETMLWTLHNRAGEAMRPDRVLDYADAVRIYQGIDYDFERSFGPSEPSHAVRSKIFDTQIRAFLVEHPRGSIVNLGEGLETQRFRIPTQDVLWLTVDLPEAIEARERFIEPDEHHLHVGCSALDETWLQHVPRDRPAFVTAQGLLMYFQPRDVQRLLRMIAKALPSAWLMFDHIPRWLSRRTTSAKGWSRTPHYTTPPMPWGVNADEVEATVRRMVPSVRDVTRVPFFFPRGPGRVLFPLVSRLPWIRKFTPGITLVRFGAAP